MSHVTSTVPNALQASHCLDDDSLSCTMPKDEHSSIRCSEGTEVTHLDLCILATDLGRLLRHRGFQGASSEPSTCTAVRLQLNRPLEELRVLITARHNRHHFGSLSKTCSFEASIHDSYDSPELDACKFAEDIASGDLAFEECWLRIDSACPGAFISIQVCTWLLFGSRFMGHFWCKSGTCSCVRNPC